jgi:hypothetical protein
VASIIEFLEARIGEDEALAIAVIAKYDPDDWENPTATGNFWPEEVAFLDSATPYRALSECEAKRAIIAEHQIDLGMSQPYCDTCAEWWAAEVGEGPPAVRYPCPTVRALAAIYKDHPDYRQEWARG